MEAKITEPKTGAYTRHELPAKGTYEKTHEGMDLWMVTIPGTMQNYHPQGTPAVLENGEWSAMAYIGNSSPGADGGVPFTLLLVSATRQASEVFRNYIATASKRQQWPGLEYLPKGAQIVDRIEVIRNDQKADKEPDKRSDSREADHIHIRDIRASDHAMVILGQKGDIHIHHPAHSVDLKETISPNTDVERKRLVVDLRKRQIVYRDIEVTAIQPRDWTCLAVLARYPGVALPVKTIYEKAIELGLDAQRFDANASNLPKPKTIRFGIRSAILQSQEAHSGFELDDDLKQEIQTLFDSRRDGTITLQLTDEDVEVIDSP